MDVFRDVLRDVFRDIFRDVLRGGFGDVIRDDVWDIFQDAFCFNRFYRDFSIMGSVTGFSVYVDGPSSLKKWPCHDSGKKRNFKKIEAKFS